MGHSGSSRSHIAGGVSADEVYDEGKRQKGTGVSPVTLTSAPERVGVALALTTQRPGPARTCLLVQTWEKRLLGQQNRSNSMIRTFLLLSV